MPKTKLGKWSAWCLAFFVIFFAIAQIIVASGQEGGETFFDNLYISIPMTLVWLSGVFAFIFGSISITKSKERSVLVFIATGIGFLMLVFILGEIFGPDH
ncbi:MAG: hypothetical protein HZC01_03160 [Candidatus Kerfeldbacteria bacterium]|nr:hypothetical protein [Candidatus Kerfeldbacteria bacterium]